MRLLFGGHINRKKEIKMSKKGNTSAEMQVVQIDVDRLISRYMTLESALQEIAAIPAGMPTAAQNITMRAIAKKALGL